MAAHTGDPDRMIHLASQLDSCSDDIETWGLAAANTMASQGYSHGATITAGSTYSSAHWAGVWANSVRSRAALLAAYDEIALVGSSAAGGAGAALAAGRHWAMSAIDTVPFEDWYSNHLANLARRRDGASLAAELEEALAADDYDAIWTIVQRLVATDDAEVAAGFFNHLGAEGAAMLPNHLIGMSSMGHVHLRASVGHPADLISHLSRQLATASRTGHLVFTGDELIEADILSDPLESPYFTGYGVEYLLIADGFEPSFLASAAAAYLPYHGHPVMAQVIQVSSIDGEFPIDPRDFLLPAVAAAGSGAKLALRLTETGRLDALLAPHASYNETAFSAVAPILEQATIGLHSDDVVAAHYVIGSLITLAATGDAGGQLDVLAGAIGLIMSQIQGITNDASHQAWLGSGDREVLVTEDQLEAAFRAFAANEVAAAALYEGILQHYGTQLQQAAGDPDSLNRIAISLGNVSSLLATAIAEANISDAKERDERMAAVVGMIDTLATLVPLPGAKQVGGQLAADIIEIGYGHLVDRGLEILETDNEGTARESADAFNDALLWTYTEFLTIGSLRTTGTVQASVDEFFAASPHLDPALYDFSDGSGGLLDDLSDRQTRAYGEWIMFASGDAAINDAISRLIAEFLRGLPHYDG